VFHENMMMFIPYKCIVNLSAQMKRLFGLKITLLLTTKRFTYIIFQIGNGKKKRVIKSIIPIDIQNRIELTLSRVYL